MRAGPDFVRWFRRAAPYIHAHRGNTFVIQIAGEAVASANFPALIHDIALLNSLAIKPVIVFGARPQIEARLREQNSTPRRHAGLRITDEPAIACVKQAVGDIRIRIEALLSMGLPNSPMDSAAIKVAAGNYVTGRPLGVVDGVDFKLSGRVRKIDRLLINTRLNIGEIILIPPLGYSITGEVFNLSSVELASRVAAELKAKKLIMIGAATHFRDQRGETLRQLTAAEARARPDMAAATDETGALLARGVEACEAGVERVHYIDVSHDGSILQELFTRDGVGTLLSQQPFDAVREAKDQDIGGIIALIAPLEEQGVLVKRSREKIEADIGDYSVLVRDGAVIGCAALHDYPEDRVMELACMAVHGDYQNQGKGALLYQFIESVAIERGAETLFVLTTQTAHWFIERGFSETDPAGLPGRRQDMYNYQRNSKALIKRLSV